jgi:hypothetical protein
MAFRGYMEAIRQVRFNRRPESLDGPVPIRKQFGDGYPDTRTIISACEGFQEWLTRAFPHLSDGVNRGNANVVIIIVERLLERFCDFRSDVTVHRLDQTRSMFR